MATRTLNTQEITDLLYRSLETELGGTQIYTAAIRCALRD